MKTNKETKEILAIFSLLIAFIFVLLAMPILNDIGRNGRENDMCYVDSLCKNSNNLEINARFEKEYNFFLKIQGFNWLGKISEIFNNYKIIFVSIMLLLVELIYFMIISVRKQIKHLKNKITFLDVILLKILAIFLLGSIITLIVIFYYLILLNILAIILILWYLIKLVFVTNAFLWISGIIGFVYINFIITKKILIKKSGDRGFKCERE